LVCFCSAQDKSIFPWGYGKVNGPSTWPALCRTGKNQSPIDIQSATVRNFCPLIFKDYQQSGDLMAINTQNTVQWTGFDKWSVNPSISGGGLKGKYVLQQIHFHWGQSGSGSEHELHGKGWDAEFHILHVKEGLTVAQGLETPDGIWIIAIPLVLNTTQNTPFNQLEDTIGKVVNFNQTAMARNIRLDVFLTQDLTSWFFYRGSFPRPPCTETTVYTIMVETMAISMRQLQLLRTLRDPWGELLCNHRPDQPLNGRTVWFNSKAAGNDICF